MKNLVYFFVLAIGLLLSSCAVTNEVHFNKNYSGTYSMDVDISGLLEMAESFDPSMAEGGAEEMLGGGISDEQKQQMDSVFATMDGISNAVYELGDDYVFRLAFDFEDIDALNGVFDKINDGMAEAGNMMDDEMGMGGLGKLSAPKFTRDGKTISHSASAPIDMGEMMSGAGDEGEMFGMMFGMMDYTFIMSSDRKIKSVEHEGVDILSQEKNVVKTRVDMDNLMNKGNFNVTIKVK